MVERWYIWQMQLLRAQKLAKFSNELGVGVWGSSGKDIQRLWQLGLLRADYIETPKELSDTGLVGVPYTSHKNPYPHGGCRKMRQMHHLRASPS